MYFVMLSALTEHPTFRVTNGRGPETETKKGEALVVQPALLLKKFNGEG